MEKQKDSIPNKKIRSILFLIIIFFIVLFSGKDYVISMDKDKRSLVKDKRDINSKVYIYLVRSFLKPFELKNIPLSEIVLEEAPFITSDDILEYDINTHIFLLNEDAERRFSKLDIPVYGRAFVFAIDDELIYLGAFWSPFSSISFDGIVIVKPATQNTQALKIQLGYPSEKFFKGKDLRANREILEVFKQK
jgi:hypothetical protein